MQKSVSCLLAVVIGLAIFFGATSSVGAQTLGFPSEEAGIAAYVKLQSINQATFDQARQNLFDYVESCGDTYMIGVKGYSATGEYIKGVAQNKIDVRLYLGANGWLAAYLKKDEAASRIVNWRDGALLQETLLKIALEDAMAKINVLPAGEAQYHDFANPGALKMTMVKESIAPNETDASGIVSSKNFSVLIQGTFKKLSWAMKSIGGYCTMGTGIKPASFSVDNDSIVSGGCSEFTYSDYTGTIFNDQKSHIVRVGKNQEQPYADVAGVFVFIYGN